MATLESGRAAAQPTPAASLPFGSQQYRDHFRATTVDRVGGRLGGKLYALVNLAVLLTILTALVVAMPAWPAHFLLLLPAYFLFINGLEYALHRFPMHRKMKGAEMVYEHVTIHHNFYCDRNFYFEEPRDFYAAILPYYIFIGLSVVIAVASGLVYLIGGLDDAMFFALCGYGYYLLYELLHFSYHAGENAFVKKLPFIRKFSRAHILHHQAKLMAHYNFNITFPIWDWLLGTSYKGPKPDGLP